MKHTLDSIAIDRMNNKYFVVDKESKRMLSIKYDDELHALRYAKFLSGSPLDYHQLNITRIWEVPVPERKITPRIPKPEIVVEAPPIVETPLITESPIVSETPEQPKIEETKEPEQETPQPEVEKNPKAKRVYRKKKNTK